MPGLPKPLVLPVNIEQHVICGLFHGNRQHTRQENALTRARLRTDIPFGRRPSGGAVTLALQGSQRSGRTMGHEAPEARLVQGQERIPQSKGSGQTTEPGGAVQKESAGRNSPEPAASTRKLRSHHDATDPSRMNEKTDSLLDVQEHYLWHRLFRRNDLPAPYLNRVEEIIREESRRELRYQDVRKLHPHIEEERILSRSVSQNRQWVDDEGACEMRQPSIVLHPLLKTGEKLSKTIVP